jgi:DNA end-binding protein Ku
MAARSTWKGFLKVSLVSIPIKVYPASESSAAVSFNQLHGECRTRIQQKRWCPTCNREVANTELVKGYEFEKGRYVVLDEADLAKVKTESTRVIDLVQFADDAALDPLYFDRAYYLAPDGAMASQAYAVMKEGMKGKVGIGKVALYGREYLVAVRPHDRGLVMFTLHHAAEIRTMDAIDELQSLPAVSRPDEIKLARQVIDTFDGALDMSNFKDEYVEGLRAIIDAKVAGQEIVSAAAEPAPKVVDLMEALRKSLDAVSTGRKKPAKADLPASRREATVEKPVARAADRKRKAG